MVVILVFCTSAVICSENYYGIRPRRTEFGNKIKTKPETNSFVGEKGGDFQNSVTIKVIPRVKYATAPDFKKVNKQSELALFFSKPNNDFVTPAKEGVLDFGKQPRYQQNQQSNHGILLLKPTAKSSSFKSLPQNNNYDTPKFNSQKFQTQKSEFNYPNFQAQKSEYNNYHKFEAHNSYPKFQTHQPEFNYPKFERQKSEFNSPKFQQQKFVEYSKLKLSKPEPSKFQANKFDPSLYQTQSYQQQKFSPTKLQPYKFDPPKFEAQKYEVPKLQAYKYRIPKVEPQKYEVPKYEVPKYESQNNEATKYEDLKPNFAYNSQSAGGNINYGNEQYVKPTELHQNPEQNTQFYPGVSENSGNNYYQHLGQNFGADHNYYKTPVDQGGQASFHSNNAQDDHKIVDIDTFLKEQYNGAEQVYGGHFFENKIPSANLNTQELQTNKDLHFLSHQISNIKVQNTNHAQGQGNFVLPSSQIIKFSNEDAIDSENLSKLYSNANLKFQQPFSYQKIQDQSVSVKGRSDIPASALPENTEVQQIDSEHYGSLDQTHIPQNGNLAPQARNQNSYEDSNPNQGANFQQQLVYQ